MTELKGKPTDRNYTNDRRSGKTNPGLIEIRPFKSTPALVGKHRKGRK